MPEKEYIERGKAHNYLDDLSSENLIGNDNDTFISLPEAHDRIDDIPTADVAEVVRCKDCVNLRASAEGYSFCAKWNVDSYEEAMVRFDDFCSYGERRKPDARMS